MAVTTTPLISSLVDKLAYEHPTISFVPGDSFVWQPSSRRLLYVAEAPDGASQLLHELAHALLGHTHYIRDIELLGFERDAWQKARQLAANYNVILSTDAIEGHLDTYRDWLHARSQCVACEQTGLQISRNTYQCVHCDTRWRVNDARMCELRRYRV